MAEKAYPIENFEFIFDPFKLNLILEKIRAHELTDEDPVGYLIMCKISLDEKYHQTFDSFPLFPERKYFPKEKCYKLVSTLETKDNYLTHAMYAQLGVKLGYSLDRIYYAISFTQTKFLAKYLHRLQNLREINKSIPFLSLLFKLLGRKKLIPIDYFFKIILFLNIFLANCVYGKNLESVFKRRNIKFYSEALRAVTDRRSKTAKKLFASPKLKSVKIITNDLVSMEFRQTKVLYNKLTITGEENLFLDKQYLF